MAIVAGNPEQSLLIQATSDFRRTDVHGCVVTEIMA